MKYSGKLELTWVNKEKEINIEPRILVEDKTKSYGDPNTENMLIHGDNLVALKALETDFMEKIKCIYIDPPYNTGSAFENYDDNVEHSIWLNLMYKRLVLLKKLLSPNGLIFIQIDDIEQAYLKILCDEVFGRNNFVNCIAVKMSEPTGVKMAHVEKRLPKLKEYILVYKKENIKLNKLTIPKEKWDDEYKLIIKNISKQDLEFVKDVMNSDNSNEEDIGKADALLKNVEFCNVNEMFNKKMSEDEKLKFKYENSWRIVRDVSTTGSAKDLADEKRSFAGNAFLICTPKKKVYLIKNGYSNQSEQPRIKLLFADSYLTVSPGDFWQDIKTTGLDNEGDVDFRNGKKPEALIQRVLKISTQEGDFVLDSFLGSGTTAAVAHKMNRKWIGIELGEQAYTHCKVRLDNIINNNDLGGISKESNWNGGGGYKFYELAEPLLVKNPIIPVYDINPSYSFEMVCEAVCKIEAFTYAPADFYHGYSTENRFIHVTLEYVNGEYVADLASKLSEKQSLIIYCLKHQRDIALPDNIEIRRIPKDIQEKCSFESEEE